MAKGKSKNVKLQSSGSSHYYTTPRKTGATNKLELMKYDPILRKHVMYKETKLPGSS